MAKENMETIRGLVKTITFHSEENGYTVAKIILDGTKKIVAATGNIKRLSEGETVVLKGYWADDPKYGHQFRFTGYESVIPSSVEGIKNFLSSSYIKGIGGKRAESIVNTFGKDTINVLENNPSRLKEVPGLSPKLIKSVMAGWQSHRDIRDVMIFSPLL